MWGPPCSSTATPTLQAWLHFVLVQLKKAWDKVKVKAICYTPRCVTFVLHLTPPLGEHWAAETAWLWNPLVVWPPPNPTLKYDSGFEPTNFQSQGGHSTLRPLSWFWEMNKVNYYNMMWNIIAKLVRNFCMYFWSPFWSLCSKTKIPSSLYYHFWKDGSTFFNSIITDIKKHNLDFSFPS